MFEIDTFYGYTFSNNPHSEITFWVPDERYIKINNTVYNFPHISIEYCDYLKRMVNSTTINENLKDSYINQLHNYEKKVKCNECMENFIKCKNADNLKLVNLNCSKFEGKLYKSNLTNSIFYGNNTENLYIDEKRSSEFYKKLDLKYFKEPEKPWWYFWK